MTLSELFNTFANNLLPILLVSGAGFLLGKYLSIDPRSVGRVIFYLFSPVLVFNLLFNNPLPLSEILRTMGFAVAVMFTIGMVALAAGWLMRLKRPLLVTVLLTAMFGNTGNYGLPLVSFAFGKDALAHASLYFVTTSIVMNTLGVLIASLGHMNFKEAALGLLKVPTMYAVMLAILLGRLNVHLPISIERTVMLAANASIPLMLVLLGLELHRVQWSNSLRVLGLSTFLRLVMGPFIALWLSLQFGLQGAARQGNVIEASMPTAVTTTVLATEYKLDSPLVTAVVFVSTLLSPFTVTPLLVYLGK
jgi:hypothetical protein